MVLSYICQITSYIYPSVHIIFCKLFKKILRSSLCWDVTQHWLVVSHRRFGTTYLYHLPLRMGAIRYPETSSQPIGIIFPWGWDWYGIPKRRHNLLVSSPLEDGIDKISRNVATTYWYHLPLRMGSIRYPETLSQPIGIIFPWGWDR